MPQSLAFVRGKIVPMEEAHVSVMTHALHYGTAVFEGIRGNWNDELGKLFVFRMEEHYERLLQGCRVMLMDLPYSKERLCEITIQLLQSCGWREDLYIRPLAYKSHPMIANLKLHELDCDFTLMAVPFGAYIDVEGAIHCTTSSWRRVDDTIIPPRVKISGHYVNSILAKTEAALAGFDEAIMLTPDGDVSEGSGENLFLVTNGEIYTPPVSANNLTGITRDSAITLAREELGIDVVERPIRRSELYLADEVFLTGTAAHITPVGSLDKRPIADGGVGPITHKLSEVYVDLIRGGNPKYADWCTEIPME